MPITIDVLILHILFYNMNTYRGNSIVKINKDYLQTGLMVRPITAVHGPLP